MLCCLSINLILFFVFIQSSSSTCPYIRRSIVLTDCVFDVSLYLSLGAHVTHSRSIDFHGHYSLDRSDDQTLIHNFNQRWMVKIPFVLRCSNETVEVPFSECQYTMRQSISSAVEYTSTKLSLMNINNLGLQSVLFLTSGEIWLRSCKAYDCNDEQVYLTASNEIFHFKITYEKSIGSKCQIDFDCSDRYSLNNLIRCDQATGTCQCVEESLSTIEIDGVGRLCTDSIDRTNCSKVPQRCLPWCNQSSSSFCVCPSSTRKVRRIDALYDCELDPEASCEIENDSIRKCPTGTFCLENRCRPLTIFRQDILDFHRNIDENPDAIVSNQTDESRKHFRLTSTLFKWLILVAIIIFILIIFIAFLIVILIKTRRISSNDEKISSSSFIISSSTIMSNDIGQENEHYQTGSFVTGLLPQNSLSPRFYRPQQQFDQRRVPMYIQSPSLSFLGQNQMSSPKLTRLENGDILITA